MPLRQLDETDVRDDCCPRAAASEGTATTRPEHKQRVGVKSNQVNMW